MLTRGRGRALGGNDTRQFGKNFVARFCNASVAKPGTELPRRSIIVAVESVVNLVLSWRHISSEIEMGMKCMKGKNISKVFNRSCWHECFVKSLYVFSRVRMFPTHLKLLSTTCMGDCDKPILRLTEFGEMIFAG